MNQFKKLCRIANHVGNKNIELRTRCIAVRGEPVENCKCKMNQLHVHLSLSNQ